MHRIGLSLLVAHSTLATLFAVKWGGLALLAQRSRFRPLGFVPGAGVWDRVLAGFPLPGHWSIYDAAQSASLLDVPSICAAGLLAGFLCFAAASRRRPAPEAGRTPEKD